MLKRIIISPFDTTVSAVICSVNDKFYLIIEDVVDYSDIGGETEYEPICILEMGADNRFHSVNKRDRSDIEFYMGYSYGSLEYAIVNTLYNIMYSNAIVPETITEFIQNNTGIDISSFKEDYSDYCDSF